MMKMMHFLLVTGLILSAGYVYKVKYQATAEAERIQQVKIAIQKERDSIATLKAQWARLNRPERLQDLASRHLGLQPMVTEQLLQIGELPPKVEMRDSMGAFIEALDARDGGLTTGTIHGKRITEGPVPMPAPRPPGGAH